MLQQIKNALSKCNEIGRQGRGEDSDTTWHVLTLLPCTGQSSAHSTASTGHK